MSRPRNIEFGNFICKFGDKDLLDFYNEVVYPAFFDERISRNYIKSKYFFKDVKLVFLGRHDEEDYIGIAGTLVNDTEIKRYQYYDETGSGIVQDEQALSSAPTSKFLLILNNHRLVYMKEVPGAPTMAQFRTTAETFLKKKNMAFINHLHAQALAIANATGKKRSKPTKAELCEMYPMPIVTLNPLPCSDEIGVFIDRFATLNDIEVIFTKRNSENDNDGLFVDIQDVQGKVGSERSTLKHHSSEGLNIEAAKRHVRSAAKQGNQFIKLTGKNAGGDILKGNNEDFQLKKEAGYIGTTTESAARSFFRSFIELVSTSAISIPVTHDRVRVKINAIKSEMAND